MTMTFPILDDVFVELVKRGVPLTLRDYRDALGAMRSGFGLCEASELRWLCETLWCRDDEDRRALAEVFDRAARWGGDSAKMQADELLHGKRGAASDASTKSSPGGPKQGASPRRTAASPEPRFAAPEESGTGIPQPTITLTSAETFILTPRPLIPQRALTVIWRRFRRARREGPAVELDVEATIEAQCREGYLTAPAMLPARRNQARLVLLLDVSPSMAAWRWFYPVLTASLRESRLGQWTVYYFHNAPGEAVYKDEERTDPVDLEREVLAAHLGAAAMVVSDAGAARGRLREERVEATKRFLGRVAPVWRDFAWLNPIPEDRWDGTSAREIAAMRPGAMAVLDETGLHRAVDALRGK